MKKLFTLLAILAVTATPAAFAYGSKSDAKAEDKKSESTKAYTEISAEELQKLQADHKDLVVIDSRGGKYFDGTVIKGAKQLSTGDTNEATLAKLAPKKDGLIVFYCTNADCGASAKAAGKAKEAGYTNIKKYTDGIDDWVKKGLETEKVEADLNK
jgi:rhodanese-related sulfurtransferase